MNQTTKADPFAPQTLPTALRLAGEQQLAKDGRRQFRARLGLHAPGATDQIIDELLAGKPATPEQRWAFESALKTSAGSAPAASPTVPGSQDKPTPAAPKPHQELAAATDRRLPLFFQDRAELRTMRRTLGHVAFVAHVARHLPGADAKSLDAILAGAAISTAQSVAITKAIREAPTPAKPTPPAPTPASAPPATVDAAHGSLAAASLRHAITQRANAILLEGA